MALRYLLTGGGTGGHVTPALAIADELKAHDPAAEFLYVGVRGKAEEILVPRAGYRLKFVRSRGYPGASNPLALLWFLIVLGLGMLRAVPILLGFRPSVIIATGGYVAAPVLFAAAVLRRLGLLKSKIFLHEQNVTPGRLNALGASFADRVGVSFPETLASLPGDKGAYVGYPVRSAATGGERAEARAELGIPEDARVVFAFGGSQGARTINRAVVDALPRLLEDPRVRVIHGTGRHLEGAAYDGAADVTARFAEHEPVSGQEERYSRQDFFHDIGRYYAAADLVVCRAGAGTLTEVCAQGLPAVVIPKANLPGDHQVANARVLERHGAARVLYEGVDLSAEGAVESVSGEALAEMASGLLGAGEELTRMAEAARQVYDPETLVRIRRLIEHLAGKGPVPELPSPERRPVDRVLGLSSNALDQLLRRLAAGSEKPLGAGEQRLVNYKIDGFLAAADYVERARGCRMVGLAGYAERLPVLIRFAAARRADGKLGETPIVRRDALVGLGGLGCVSETVVETLQAGLSDPYFEARAAAAEAAAALGRSTGEPGPLAALCEPMTTRLADRSFEPRAAAARALGEIGGDGEVVVAALRRLYFDRVWKVRSAVFDAISRLVERGVLPPNRAEEEMGRVLITSTGYITEYPLKEAYNHLRHVVNGKEGE